MDGLGNKNVEKEIVKPEILKYTTYLEYVCSNYAWWSHAQAALGDQESATSLRKCFSS